MLAQTRSVLMKALDDIKRIAILNTDYPEVPDFPPNGEPVFFRGREVLYPGQVRQRVEEFKKIKLPGSRRLSCK